MPKDNTVAFEIALFHSNSLRVTIKPGNVTSSDVHMALPFGDTIDSFMINYKKLKAVLEQSASTLGASDATGTFLQVSGNGWLHFYLGIRASKSDA